jgi:hypothetical protein
MFDVVLLLVQVIRSQKIVDGFIVLEILAEWL